MEYTDPALELADACSRLMEPSGNSGDELLAEKFGVSPWSKEFFEILFTFVERADLVYELLDHPTIDVSARATALGHVNGIKEAFGRRSLASRWDVNGIGLTNLREHVPPLRMASFFIRSRVAYPKLGDAQIKECVGMVDELLDWLREHQLEDEDFIRAALIDGLQRFRFRMLHIQWLGWGYTVESLRAVIGAYMALERGSPDPDVAPMAVAMLAKVTAVLKGVYKKIGATKEFVERADFVLRAYGLASVVRDSGVAGLLTHSG